MMTGMATETIPFGAHVLCRGFRVSLAAREIANGTACNRPLYRGDKAVYEPGQHVTVEPVNGLGHRNLHALANGPIMDPSSLYLPAGKLSMAEARAREAANMEQLP
jgi:hypothetical protein